MKWTNAASIWCALHGHIWCSVSGSLGSLASLGRCSGAANLGSTLSAQTERHHAGSGSMLAETLALNAELQV